MTTPGQGTNERYQMKELLAVIGQADSVLLFCHISPDGDTIGSAMALKMLLEQLKKRVIVVLDGIVPANLFFLPDIYSIRRPEDVMGQVDVAAGRTLAIAVDTSCRDRLGAAEALFSSMASTAQIDHHETNPAYAQINLIDGAAPATAILVSRLQQELGAKILPEVAICLYTALSTDTGNFVYENTNAEAFLLMSRLMEAGLPLAKYSRVLFKRKEKAFVGLLGKALPTLTFLANGEIAGMRMGYADMISVGATGENTDGVVDYAIDTSGVKMAYFARETEEGAIKFSLRALSPYRVDGVAAAFGGGGHQLAAGCTLHMPMAEAVGQMQAALEKAREGSPSA